MGGERCGGVGWGGVGCGGGELARYTKAEVGVLFPVNTELQRVRGEGFSNGYAEGTCSLNLKHPSESQNGSAARPTHFRLLLIPAQQKLPHFAG